MRTHPRSTAPSASPPSSPSRAARPPTTSSVNSGQAVSAGQIFNFGALAHPGSCMDARGAGTADGTQIQEWDCNGTGAQSFELEDAGGGAFAIVNTNANKCVDVQGARHRRRDQDPALRLQPDLGAELRRARRRGWVRLVREHEQRQVPRRRRRQPRRRHRRAALRLQRHERAALEPHGHRRRPIGGDHRDRAVRRRAARRVQLPEHVLVLSDRR